jgi:hypothetical protein
LLRLQLHELAKDKLIAQISGSFLIIGSGTLFVAASWKLLATGHLLASLGSAFAGKKLNGATASHSNQFSSILSLGSEFSISVIFALSHISERTDNQMAMS